MVLLFTKSFEKQVNKLSHEARLVIKNKIIEIQDAESLSDFDLKKLTGYKDYYRIRVGKYRIGIEIKDKTVIFRAVAKREIIYKIFP